MRIIETILRIAPTIVVLCFMWFGVLFFVGLQPVWDLALADAGLYLAIMLTALWLTVSSIYNRVSEERHRARLIGFRSAPLLLLLICPLSFTAEEETQAELPRSAERIVGAYEKELADALEAYEEAKADARQDALKDLGRELTKVTKKGDLEGALAIKAVIEQLEAEESQAEESQMLGRPMAVPPGILGKFLDKKYRVIGRTDWVHLQPNKEAVHSSGLKGKWVYEADQINVSWPNGYTDMITDPADGSPGYRMVNNAGSSWRVELTE